MRIAKLTTKDYTEFEPVYQLKLPLELETLIPVDDSVRLLSKVLEGLDYTKLYQAYSIKGRKPSVDPKIMFKVLTYAYMNGIYTSHKIEQWVKSSLRTYLSMEQRLRQMLTVTHLSGKVL